MILDRELPAFVLLVSSVLSTRRSPAVNLQRDGCSCDMQQVAGSRMVVIVLGLLQP
jgi:hypothetical protein